MHELQRRHEKDFEQNMEEIQKLPQSKKSTAHVNRSFNYKNGHSFKTYGTPYHKDEPFLI